MDISELAGMHTEELHEDLKPYVEQGAVFDGVDCLRHPLVVMPFLIPGAANRQYLQKLELLDKPKYAQPSKRIWLYERPFRLPYLIDMMEYGECDDGQLLAKVWIDSEASITLDDELGQRVYEAFLEYAYLTDDPENAPKPTEEIDVWRAGKFNGISWTTEFEVAEFFARRNVTLGKPTTIWHGKAMPNDILARFISRSEAEAILDPANLSDVEQVKV